MMTFVFGIIFGALVGYFAHKRGYSFWAYFTGSPIVGIVALLLLPDFRNVTMEEDEAKKAKTKGNNIGWIITALTWFLGLWAYSTVSGNG